MANQETINEIRSKIDLVDFIGEYVPLVQKGKNYFGVCPFHNDTNPSLSVSREKQIYKCFSCGASGNVYTFLMDYDHIDFPTALSILGRKAGVDVADNSVGLKTSKYSKYYEIYNFASKYFQNNLNTPSGSRARAYLNNRGIDDETIKEFEIGLSLSEKDALTKIFKDKEYNLVELENIGLIADGHDMYINRIMFPLYDPSGNAVGFSGRIYDDSKDNKYVNTKETVIFKKGQCLYNYHQAKDHARKERHVILVEGFMDVIRLSTIGYKNVVALMGTAMTSEQVSLLKKLSPNVLLMLDGDNAGQNASLSIGEMLEKENVNVKVALLKDDDDPDTFIVKNGKERFNSLVESAIDFYDFKVANMRKDVNFDNDISLAAYVDKVLKESISINDELRLEIILKKLAKESNISYNTLEKRLQEYKKSQKPETKIVAEQKTKKDNLSKYDKAAYGLIHAMLNSETAIAKYKSANVQMTSKVLKGLADEICYYQNKFGNVNEADFYSYLQNQDDLLEMYNKVVAENFDFPITDQLVDDLIGVIDEYVKRQEVSRLKKLIEEEQDPIEKAKISDKIRRLRIGE